jgi:hypothetical protein
LGRSAVCELVIGWREFAMTDSEGLAAKSPALASRQGNDLGVDWPAWRPIVVELGGLAKERDIEYDKTRQPPTRTWFTATFQK